MPACETLRIPTTEEFEVAARDMDDLAQDGWAVWHPEARRRVWDIPKRLANHRATSSNDHEATPERLESDEVKELKEMQKDGLKCTC